jgi:2-C-methyl-D-erythritol 2,4-cyclodiphosphate synthase
MTARNRPKRGSSPATHRAGGRQGDRAKRGTRASVREHGGQPLQISKVGFGFDLHPLVPERALVLGGVTVPFEFGLGGHSDADVLSHAIGEALLGALALGDLGRHFPDTDARYRGISSLALLREVVKLVGARGGRLVNVDATILAQAPKLSGLLPEMAKRLADTLGIPVDATSVKAKSPEGLGFLGRKEGMAAMAVVSVEVASR